MIFVIMIYDDGDLENDAFMPNTNRKAEGRRPRVFTEQERMQKLLISKWNMKVLAMTIDHDNDARASHFKKKYNVLYLLILEPGDFSGKKAKEVVPW